VIIGLLPFDLIYLYHIEMLANNP